MDEAKSIGSSAEVSKFIRSTYERGKIELQEQFVALFLDHQNKPIGYYRHTLGTKSSTSVDIDLMVATALKANATSIIIAHNHPSGGLKPSEADKLITLKVKEALASHQVNLLDHIIVTKTGHYSFADHGQSGLGGFIDQLPDPIHVQEDEQEDEIDEPMPTKPTMKGVMSANDLMDTHFETINLTGAWADIFEMPEKNMNVMIYGKPKNGKTVFSMKMADRLSAFGKVLYNVADQGFTESTKRIMKIANLSDNPNVEFSDTRDIKELERLLPHYDFIFIDLINKYKLKPEEWELLMRKYRDKGFILVFSSTKEGNFKGGNDWQHDVDQIIEVKDFIAYSTGRYGSGEYNVWKDRN